MLVSMLDQEMEEANMIYNKQMQRIADKQNPYVDKNSSSENSRLKKNAAMSVGHGNIANARKKSNSAHQFNELLICISQT